MDSVDVISLLLVSLLQFFLSLYGHKLPVLCLDISHVSTVELQNQLQLGLNDNMSIWFILQDDESATQKNSLSLDPYCKQNVGLYQQLGQVQFIPVTSQLDCRCLDC